VKYSVSSCFALRHVKYVYDCVKPSLASQYMTFGRVNASARKIRSGFFALRSAIIHSQNANGLVCGLSTRKMRTPCSIQNSMTLFSSFHNDCQCEDSNSKG